MCFPTTTSRKQLRKNFFIGAIFSFILCLVIATAATVSYFVLKARYGEAKVQAMMFPMIATWVLVPASVIQWPLIYFIKARELPENDPESQPFNGIEHHQ